MTRGLPFGPVDVTRRSTYIHLATALRVPQTQRVTRDSLFGPVDVDAQQRHEMRAQLRHLRLEPEAHVRRALVVAAPTRVQLPGGRAYQLLKHTMRGQKRASNRFQKNPPPEPPEVSTVLGDDHSPSSSPASPPTFPCAGTRGQLVKHRARSASKASASDARTVGRETLYSPVNPQDVHDQAPTSVRQDHDVTASETQAHAVFKLGLIEGASSQTGALCNNASTVP